MPALVIDAHPDPDSLVAALAATYAAAHGDARLLTLRDLEFDPVLHGGYTRRQQLEPDLEDAWQAILDADRVVIVSPIWWGASPPVLKGFLDRVLLPRRAFRYLPNGLPEGLLSGRAGRLILTTDSPAWWFALTRNSAAIQLRTHTMRFCGLRTPRATVLGPVRRSDARRRALWLDRVAAIARRDASSARRRGPRREQAQASSRSASSSATLKR